MKKLKDKDDIEFDSFVKLFVALCLACACGLCNLQIPAWCTSMISFFAGAAGMLYAAFMVFDKSDDS